MRTDIADRWIVALCSGEYEQAQDKLRGINSAGNVGFCCLGVLCDLHSKETGTTWNNSRDTYMGSVISLPAKVVFWAGMHHAGLLSILVGTIDHLSTLNDNLYTFTQIADVIEAQKTL